MNETQTLDFSVAAENLGAIKIPNIISLNFGNETEDGTRFDFTWAFGGGTIYNLNGGSKFIYTILDNHGIIESIFSQTWWLFRNLGYWEFSKYSTNILD